MIAKRKRRAVSISILTLIVFTWLISTRQVSDTTVDNGRDSTGYVINLRYMGQQASAEQALILQQCWLGALGLNMSIVEPFLVHTNYQGHPPFNVNISDVLSFSDLNDIETYNNVSRQKGFAQLATWTEFIENAPRKVIFVISSNLNYSITKASKINGHCYETNVHFFFEKDFCIVRIVQLSKSSYMSLYNKYVINLIFGSWRPEDITIVFNYWKQSNGANRNGICNQVFRKKIIVAPSKQLLTDAQLYQKNVLAGNNELSVMIRLERLIEQSAEGGHEAVAIQNKEERRAYVEHCFTTLIEKVQSYRLQNSRKPFIATDIGKFASKSWKHMLSELNYSKEEKEHIFSLTKAVISMLVNDSFPRWENTFLTTSKSKFRNIPGYIAAMQRTIASMGACLILFGGGNFQEMALSAYIHNHPIKSSQCVKIVCASKELRRNLMTVLKTCSTRSML